MDKEDIEKRVKEIEVAMTAPNFWSDKQAAQALIKELHGLKAQGERGYEEGNAVLSIVAGAGGDDAEDFARMLFEMYSRFAGKRGWAMKVLHQNVNDHQGFRNLSVEILGKGAYGVLKGEYGVHRLVRISPFSSTKKRHTSFVLIEILPVLQSVSDIEIPADDLEISFTRSSGPGGQNVNKRETAVRVVHTGTGISAHVDGERSQNANRERAISIVKAKLLKRLQEERKEKIADLSKEQKIEWGSQIRSYVLHPYQLVKDHRSNVEVRDAQGVLAGEIEPFLADIE